MKSFYKKMAFVLACTLMVGGIGAPCEKANAAVKTSVKVAKTKLSLYAGQSKKIKYTVKRKTKKTKLIWRSANKKIATVSKSGKVTGKKAGKVKISVRVKGSKKVSACTVTVKKKAVQTKAPSMPQITTTTQAPTATIKPSASSSSTPVTTTSSTPGVSTQPTQTPTSDASSAPSSSPTPVVSTEPTQNPTSSPEPTQQGEMYLSAGKLRLSKDSEFKVEVTFEKEEDQQEVTYTSIDNEIATVTSEGVIRAVAVGSTTITATSADGKMQANTVVTVQDNGTATPLLSAQTVVKDGNVYTVYFLDKSYSGTLHIQINGREMAATGSVTRALKFLEEEDGWTKTNEDQTIVATRHLGDAMWTVTDSVNAKVYYLQGYQTNPFDARNCGAVSFVGDVFDEIQVK